MLIPSKEYMKLLSKSNKEHEKLKKSIALLLKIDSKQIKDITYAQNWKEYEKKIFKILITVTEKE